ncbi:YqeG family HAD IIIA-type phosphatase [Candidatus Mycoplasma mahonii]|uniref:YqeG family HAD IIIA-type phosphatase n=1 Tax=Candidatus Mycoplasma mahonii TaxID=3004105 RepID=UPI0026E93E20|nr:YqeG family HAD IIIA-type phosphatase [Candidatus Mycoplasma mahonii]WKX02348.1 YqeG family HAD IIIA-type phosphatase [Candidatus Mycoplasma mahonii]
MKRKRGLLSNYFKPSIYVRSFKDVNISQLKRQGIKLFISDLDNTLVPHFTKLPNKDVIDFVNRLKSAEIEVVIMSNNTTKRTGLFAAKAGVKEFYGNAKKPFRKSAKEIMKKRDLKPSEVIMMGDQIIMDTLVSNLMNWESILVQPLVSTDYKMSSFNVFLENFIYKKLERQNILKSGKFTSMTTNNSFELL